MSDFKKVVNLQKKEEKPRPEPQRRPVNKKIPQKKTIKKSRAEEIDQVFRNDDNDKAGIAKFERPIQKEGGTDIYKQASVFLLLVIIIMLSYFFYSTRINGDENEEADVVTEGAWYAVQLVDEETYYGYINDTSADPIVIENVYYNYNQVVGQDQEEKSSSIRLVKRGKESHGPDGSMKVVRSQVLFMETLRDDSKILRAIMEYEK